MSVETLLNKSFLGGAQAQVIQLNGSSDKFLTLSKRKGRQFLKDFCEAHESMIPLGLHKSTADLSELISQRGSKGFHARFLFGIDETAVGIESLKGQGDDDLVGGPVDMQRKDPFLCMK